MRNSSAIETLLKEYEESVRADPNANPEHLAYFDRRNALNAYLKEQNVRTTQLEVDVIGANLCIEKLFEHNKTTNQKVDNVNTKVDDVVSEFNTFKEIVSQATVQTASPTLGSFEQRLKQNWNFKFKKCYPGFWDLAAFKTKVVKFLHEGDGSWHRYDNVHRVRYIVKKDLIQANIDKGLPLFIAQTKKSDNVEIAVRSGEYKVPPDVTLRMVPSWFFTGVTGFPSTDDPIINMSFWTKYQNFCKKELEAKGIASGSSQAYSLIRNWALDNAAANSISANLIL